MNWEHAYAARHYPAIRRAVPPLGQRSCVFSPPRTSANPLDGWSWTYTYRSPYRRKKHVCPGGLSYPACKLRLPLERQSDSLLVAFCFAQGGKAISSEE